MTKIRIVERVIYAAIVCLALSLLWLFDLLPRLSLKVEVVYQGF